MSPAQLERYLHEQIPLSKTMQVGCVSVTQESVVLRAPLAPNINHHATLFGGSASALAILAAWSLLHVRLREASIACRLVIQRNTMEYQRPIKGTFTAASALPEPQRWQAFLRMLERKGTARASVISELVYADRVAGQFLGEFVALAGDAA